MLANDDITLPISLFLKDPGKKVLLLYGQSISRSTERLVSHVKSTNLPSFYFDMAESSNIENSLANIPLDHLSIFVLYVTDLENPFLRYHFDRWQCKVIILCDQSLLHPTLDPTIYFAPFKDGKVQRRLLSKAELRRDFTKTAEQVVETKKIPPVVQENNPEQSNKFSNHFLNKKLMANDPVMMQMLADRVLVDEVYKDFLFKLIYTSREDEGLKIAAANAITILNYAKINLSKLNFSKVNILGADLSSANLSHANLSGANLRNVNFKQAFLDKTNFQGSFLEGANFGEEAYLEHDNAVHAICFSRDGRYLATATDTVINIWDWPLRKIINVFNSKGYVSSLEFSQDLQFLYVGGGKNIEVRRFLTGELIDLLREHTADIYAIKCDPEGSLLVSGGEDFHIKVWSVSTRRLFYQLMGHTSVVMSLAFGTSRKQLVSGSLDDTVMIWDMEKRHSQRSIKAECGGVTCVSVSPDNANVISAGQDGSIKLWNISDGQLRYIFCKSGQHVNSVSFNSTGQLFVSGSFDNTVKLWEVATGQLQRTFQGHTMQVTRVCFSPDNVNILSSSFDKTVHVWDVSPYSSQYNNIIYKIPKLSMSGDGRLLLVADHFDLHLCNTGTGELVSSWKPSMDGINPHDQEEILRGVHWVDDADLSYDGEYVVWTNWNDKNIHVAQTRSGKLLHILQGPKDLVVSAKFSPSGKFIASLCADKTITFWNLSNGQVLQLKDNNNEPTMIIYSPDGKFVVWGCRSGKIIMWNMQENKVQFTYPAHTKNVVGMEFSKDGRLFVSCSENDIKVIVLATGLILKVNNNELNNASLSCISISPNGKRLVTGNNKGLIHVWNLETGDIVDIIFDPSSTIRELLFHPLDSDCFVSAGADGIVKYWQYSKQQKQGAWSIKWRSATTLYCHGVNIQDAVGLSENNKRLLGQRGAVGKAREIEETSNDKLVYKNLHKFSITASGSSSSSLSSQQVTELTDDEELKRAIAMSLEDPSTVRKP